MHTYLYLKSLPILFDMHCMYDSGSYSDFGLNFRKFFLCRSLNKW